MLPAQGIVNLIKPPAMTSFQAVRALKRLLSIKKAGHTGTLDPAAAGVLPVCYGRATKVIPFLKEEKKTYIAEVILGKMTTTLDREGEIINEDDCWRNLSLEEINNSLSFFRGEIEQIPPMYSALHHQGKRLYELAREGKEVEREARQVKIYEINILSIDLPRIRLKITASRGTYIRSLVRDLGEKLGSCAYLSFLVRTRSGPFFISQAITFEKIDYYHNISDYSFIGTPDQYLDYPGYLIIPEARKKAVNGAYLMEEELKDFDPEHRANGDLILIYSPRNEFIAISKVEKDEEIIIKPEKVFI